MKVEPSLDSDALWLPLAALRVPPPSVSLREEPSRGSSSWFYPAG
jgi:hypothetical protein